MIVIFEQLFLDEFPQLFLVFQELFLGLIGRLLGLIEHAVC